MSFHSALKRHAIMVFDFERTLPILHAIEKKINPGDVVLDIGCGLGILSFAACRAGAKRVYAIEVDTEAIEFAKWQGKKLGLSNKICWLNELSQHVELIEKADGLIQETIGFYAFEENFLQTLADAKKRLLKPKAKIIPEEVSLIGAPLGKKKLLATPTVLTSIKTKSCKKSEIDVQKKWQFKEEVLCRGVLVWPKVTWSPGAVTDSSPLKNPTHWGQKLLDFGKSKAKIAKKTSIHLKIGPKSQNSLYETEIRWKLTDGTRSLL